MRTLIASIFIILSEYFGIDISVWAALVFPVGIMFSVVQDLKEIFHDTCNYSRNF